jgi:hypothetical protein
MALRVPNIGEWFIDKHSNQLFEIVAIDARSNCIEVQYVDGELSEFDVEGWTAQELEPAAAPEDWSASYEMVSEDRDSEAFTGQNLDPLNTIESDIYLGTDELY